MRLGVAGWPVAHSRSPDLQNAALHAAGLDDWRYQLLPIPPERFEESVRALPAAGFRGINVTIPHKPAALRLAERPSRRARAIGAANTLLFERGDEIVADNTDAPGLIAALPFAPAGCSALVLGAGGTARAAVWALRDAGAADVRVWNRTPERADALCAELGGRAVQRAAPADVLVNCTPHGLDDQASLVGLPVVAEDLTEFGVVVDFVYRDAATALIEAAAAAGASTVDGRELLIAQGALSFEQFTGLPAPVMAMRRAVSLE